MFRSQNSISNRPRYSPCAKCSRDHRNECLADQWGSFGCGRLGHGLKDCPHDRQGNRNSRPQALTTSAPATLPCHASVQGTSSSTTGSQRQNRFNALPSHQEQENSPNVVTGILCVFFFDVYVFWIPG